MHDERQKRAASFSHRMLYTRFVRVRLNGRRINSGSLLRVMYVNARRGSSRSTSTYPSHMVDGLLPVKSVPQRSHSITERSFSFLKLNLTSPQQQLRPSARTVALTREQIFLGCAGLSDGGWPHGRLTNALETDLAGLVLRQAAHKRSLTRSQLTPGDNQADRRTHVTVVI
jgi:hypothetical protein